MTMLSSFGINFLSPLALIALVGLLIPIAIHLFSRSKGKLIKLGTIKFIPQIAPVKMLQMRWTEILLLIVRLVMLLLSILLLAKIFVDSPSLKQSNVQLVSSGWLNAATKAEREQLMASSSDDSRFLLNPQLSPLSDIMLESWQEPSSSLALDPGLVNNSKKLNLSVLINAMAQQLAIDAHLSLYLTNHSEQFPTIKQQSIKLKSEQKLTWQIKELNKNNSSSLLTKIIKVALVIDEDRKSGSNKLIKALEVIKANKLPNLSISIINDLTALNSGALPQWLFYLSSAENESEILRLANFGVNVFIDAQQQEVILTDDNQLVNGRYLLLPAKIKKLKKINASSSERILWRNEAQQVVLTQQIFHQIKENTVNAKSTSQILRFYSRFDSSWSNLAEQPQFVQIIFSLLAQNEPSISTISLLQIEQLINLAQQKNQLLDRDLPFKNSPSDAFDKAISMPINKTWLSQWLISLLVLFWLLERLVSEFSIVRRGSDD